MSRKMGTHPIFCYGYRGRVPFFSFLILDSRFEREKQGAEGKQEGAAVEPQGKEEQVG
jgi:hypothetical protein